MKVLVLHDKRGNILSLGVPGHGLGAPVRLLPEQGQEVTEMEAPDIAGDITDETDLQPLQDLLENHRLELSGEKPRFVRK